MDQLRFTGVSSLLLGATLTLGCSSSDDRTPAVAAPSSSVDRSTPATMNEPTDPGSSEAQPDEMAPAPSAEGPSGDVELSPSSTEDATPAIDGPVAGEEQGEGDQADEEQGEEEQGEEEEQVPPTEDEPAADGAPVPSAGCGSTAPVQSGRFTISAAGAAREYILELPENYDSNRAHRLIFGWHWRGGTAQQVADGFYGLEQRAEGSAIFVSPEGLDAGWANPGGRDLAFLDAVLERVEGELCVDESRIFSTGWSYGGMMTLALGCARGDVFRAIAPMSGAFYSGCEDSDTPVAFFGYHGNNDDVVPYGNGVAARDEFVRRNGCQPEQAAVDVNGCLQFEGCAAGAPLTWCEFNGGHTPGPGSEQRIWDFFSQF